jgi:hypothetical protein
MTSILLKVSGRRQSENISAPIGKYDPQAQMWDIIAGAGTVEEGMGIYAATGSSTTYSATTSTGKDNDSDDKGT